MKENMPLVGDDGCLMLGKDGATYTGDGTKTLNELVTAGAAGGEGKGYYVVTKKAATGSIFPDGLEVGEMYPAIGTEVLATGDEVMKIDLSIAADCSGWEFDVSQTEIDVTTLCDGCKKYRLGKKDVSGKATSIMTLGVSDKPDGMIGRSMKLFERKYVEGQPVVTVSESANESLYFQGWCRKTEVTGETQAFIFAKVYMFNAKFGGASGSAQSYDASIRLTGKDPVFYSLEVPPIE